LQATSIYEPIQPGLARVDDKLRKVGNSHFPFLSQLLDHVFKTEGKRVRPAITLLAASFREHDRSISEIMATAVELLHMATLIHDDTVDDSDFRRGKATISNLWGRNVAVLLGDFIFAASATNVCDTDNVRVIRRFSETIMDLSSGELQELADAYNADQTMDDYLHRIYKKTASLFATAGESGAILSGQSEEDVESLKSYGYNVGMAFQIVDDILDFKGTAEEVGKPVGSDLSHGIMTLPAILALQGYPDDNPIPHLFLHPEDAAHLERAIDMIQNSSIIEDSYAAAEKYCGKALDTLSRFPKSPSRESLEELAGYILSRRR